MDLFYLLRSGLGIPDYWHPFLEIQTDFEAGEIRRYPVSMRTKADYPGHLNDEGVPVVYLKGTSCVLPATVALYGLGNHDAFLETGDKRFYDGMTCATRWLDRHRVPLGDGIGWRNEEAVPVYGLTAPWFSGLVQGLALSLFVRASGLEVAGPWSRLAYETWRGYRVPVEAGGFCRKTDHGVIYEEYPAIELDCVFNGMCHALIGLWEASMCEVTTDAMPDFDKGVRALRALLPRFAYGSWSLYSLNQCLGKPLLASPYYQRSNGLLAQVIGRMAKEPEFQTYGKRWQQSSESILLRIRLSVRVALDRYIHAPDLLHSDKAINKKNA